MKFYRFILFGLLSVCCLVPFTRAQEGAVPVWQMTQFDITVNLPSATSTDRTLTAHAVLAARNVGQAAGRSFTVRINPAAEIKAATVGDASAHFDISPDTHTKLRQVKLTLPGQVAPGGAVQVTLDYSLSIAENSGLNAISPEGAQFLPLSYWYPAPNTQFAPHGVDTAPVRLTINGAASGETIVAPGRASGPTFEQTLNARPFFLTGKWEAVDGTGEARGISALLGSGVSAEERRRATDLIALASSARTFYAGLLGPAPEAPVRLVAVQRGGGFDDAGTLLLDAPAFRRSKTDSVTAMQVAEAVAHLWIGGATMVSGGNSGAVREGLARFLAALFIEKQFGREAAESERLHERIAFAAIAKHDAPLSQTTPFDETYYVSVADKGAMVWRLVEKALGRDAFLSILRAQFQPRRDAEVTLASLRSAFAERGGAPLKTLLDNELDQPTDMDLLVGLPQAKEGEWVSALRNTGSFDAAVSVVAVTSSGERLAVDTVIPARDFGEAHFKTVARIVRVEVDPDKFYPQLDYSNDVAPRAPSFEETTSEATRLFAQQDYARVEALTREMLARAPLTQEARILLARALLEQNRLDEAEKEFRAVLDLPLPLPTALQWADVGLGEIAFRKKQAAEAARHFNDAVHDDAEYAATLAARAGRLKAEAAAGNAPAPDERARAFISQLDTAIRSGHKAELDPLIIPGELVTFEKGIVGAQPEQWQTRVLRTELLSDDRLAADVAINARTLGHDQSGTAVFVLARTGGGWRLAAIQFFEVR